MQRVGTFHENPSGTLWIGTERGLGIIRNERYVPVTPETSRSRVTGGFGAG